MATERENRGDPDIYIDTVAPAPEKTEKVSLRLYEADMALLTEMFPGSSAQPLRRIVRKFTDNLRRERGLKVLGQPVEPDYNAKYREVR